MDQISCCCFDLETTNLSADFGIVLCAVVKGANEKPVILRADELNPKWLTRRANDKTLIRAIVQELDRWDIWIAHNGAKFDVPFLRTRMLKWGLEPLAAKKLVDPVQLARNKLRMSYNSLDKVASHLGVNSKTDVDPDQWTKASLDGDRKSMDYIVEHCVQDVLVLEKVIGALKHYSTNLNTWGSGF